MLDSVDRRILELIQDCFPIVPEPYRALANLLRLSEAEVIERVRRMSEDGIIRRLGAIFDSRGLGYTGVLCAMSVGWERIAEVADVVNSFSEVTHNYLREHDFNMWFTVLAESEGELEEIISKIRLHTGLEVMVLPAENIFKIQVSFELK